MTEKKKSTELATKPDEETALTVNEAELNEMFGESSLDASTGLSFNNVKIMRESAQFEVGPDNYVKTLTGHILFKHRACQWWKTAFEERGEGDDPTPQCYSINGVKPCGGEDIQSDLCSSCELDKYGSDPKEGSRGKACRNTMRFLFLQDEAVIPVILTAPPTSLSKKGLLQHWLNAVPSDVAAAYNAIDLHTKKGGPIVDYWPAHIELSLEKKEFGDGLSASLLGIKTLDVVTPKSDPSKLRLLFKIRNDVIEIYQSELERYIVSETAEKEVVETESQDAGAATEKDDCPI